MKRNRGWAAFCSIVGRLAGRRKDKSTENVQEWITANEIQLAGEGLKTKNKLLIKKKTAIIVASSIVLCGIIAVPIAFAWVNEGDASEAFLLLQEKSLEETSRSEEKKQEQLNIETSDKPLPEQPSKSEKSATEAEKWISNEEISAEDLSKAASGALASKDIKSSSSAAPSKSPSQSPSASPSSSPSPSPKPTETPEEDLLTSASKDESSKKEKADADEKSKEEAKKESAKEEESKKEETKKEKAKEEKEKSSEKKTEKSSEKKTEKSSEKKTEKSSEKKAEKSSKDKTIDVADEIKLKNDDREDLAPPKESEVEKEMLYEVTAYTHTGEPTSLGDMPEIGTIAVNPKQIPYGTKLYVEGYGYGVAGDTGGFRHSGKKQIDLFMNTERECQSWGRKRNVRIYILKD